MSQKYDVVWKEIKLEFAFTRYICDNFQKNDKNDKNIGLYRNNMG